MTKKFLILIMIILFGINSFVFAGAGTSGAAFLKIIPTARISSLGSTGALIGGLESIFVNPAGLAEEVTGSAITLSQVNWLAGINYSNLAWAKRFSCGGTFGAGINYLLVPEIVKYDDSGNKLNETFAPNDLAINFAYGYKAKIFSWESNVGANLKFVKTTLDDKTAQSVAVDLGWQSEIPDTSMWLGLVIQNLGTELKFNRESDPLPLNIKLGAKYPLVLKEQKINFASDLNYTNDSQFWASVGAEYLKTFGGISTALRLGWRSGVSGLSGSGGAAGGLGIGWRGYTLDYGFAPYGDLGDSHRITLGVMF
jgi:hypothetical protein